MAEHRCTVDSERFKLFLTGMGFSETIVHEELVFTKRSDVDANLVIKVYTSIAMGADVARAVGKDAIRVVVIFDNGSKTFGVGKFSRVYRTGSHEKVEERTALRIQAAIDRCVEWKGEQATRQAASNNVRNEPTAKPPEPVIGGHVGAVGDELRIVATVISRKPWSNKFLFTMRGGLCCTIDRGRTEVVRTRDDSNDIFTYWSERDVLQAGETYDMRCVVRKHTTFRNVNQTEITKCVGKRVVM